MTEKNKKAALRAGVGAAMPSYRIEADGGLGFLTLAVFGVVGIGELSDEKIKLITKRESITVTGKVLRVSIFERNSLELVGKIENISLGGGRGAVKSRDGKG